MTEPNKKNNFSANTGIFIENNSFSETNYSLNFLRYRNSPYVFRFWFEAVSGHRVALGLGLLGFFLFFTVWLRLSRNILPRSLELLADKGFWTVIIFGLTVNLTLLLVYLGLPGLVNKKLFGGRPGVFQKILDKIIWLAKTPSMFGYHLVMHLPSPLIKILLWYFPHIPNKCKYRFNWVFLYIPWLVPPLVLNLEVLSGQELYHFYQSLVLLVIPVLSRQVLGLVWCTAQAMANQTIRNKRLVIHTKTQAFGSDKTWVTLEVNRRIPLDQHVFHGQHWTKAIANDTVIRGLDQAKTSHDTIRRVNILRSALYCLGWLTLLLKAPGYI